MKAYLHFSSTRSDGTKDSFQTISVPAKRREDGALMVLWGRWRLVRNGHVMIEGHGVPAQLDPLACQWCGRTGPGAYQVRNEFCSIQCCEAYFDAKEA